MLDLKQSGPQLIGPLNERPPNTIMHVCLSVYSSRDDVASCLAEWPGACGVFHTCDLKAVYMIPQMKFNSQVI